MDFTFVHAADLHLDSPLLGLARKSEAYAARVGDASRRAFDNLVDLAIAERCRFLLIAGDVFDGQWRDYRTGLFFVDRMRRLRDVGIDVVMILGNHDAENRFADRLERSPNVRILSSRESETVRLEDVAVAIHGRSFPQRDVTENLARDYPPPSPDRFNIGLLHTACEGRAGHASYAPCTVEQLENHGYDYWALGHVHAHEVLSTDPYIVFPGNLQGRNPRETGAKGAMLVRVEDGRIAGAEHRALDVVRWGAETLDLSGIDQVGAVHAMARAAVERAYAAADGRALALRLRLAGSTALHHEIVVAHASLRDEIDTMAADVADDIWIEKLDLATRALELGPATDPTIAGKLRGRVEERAADASTAEFLDRKLAELRAKMPAGAHVEPLFERLRAEMPARARDLARALIERGQG